VEEYGNDEDVRIFDRLFLGGARTLRGFRYRHAGPLDETGEPIGGKTLLAGTAEYTFPIIQPIRGALFYDIGNVWSDAFDASSEFYSDAGFGIRFDIPAFPVQLDYAWPLDTPKGIEGRSGRFNFSLGYEY
ncbi:MAG: BamA/TamA family outer membrane protein, partial [Lentisphaerae bacterium]|nr:BamA/TamA family outer membrane protein [Lentisphaerota bacterium]